MVFSVEVIAILAIFVFVFKFGILGVFIAVLSDEAIRAVINSVRFGKIKF